MSNITSIKWFKTKSTKGIVFDMIFTGMMLSLVFLFNYLQNFMPWLGGALKINLSLIFILASWIISGYPWALSIIIIRTIIGPALGPFSYTIIGMYSTFLLFFSEAFYLIILISSFYLFKNLIKNQMLFLTLILSIATLISIIFLTIMNGLWMSPIFWRLFNPNVPLFPGVTEYYSNHDGLHGFLFGIPNYWAAIWTVMGSGNLLKFSIISVLILPIIKVSKYLI